MSGISNFLFGGNAKHERVSTLLPQQQPLADQAIKAGLKPGAGGAFGDAADYYRNNLSDNPADFQAFANPALRQYNEDIVPGLSEQFAGMGAGNLNSSGFRNAQIQGATDLSERLGALRAQLRQNSAQGLQGIGQAGLQNFSQDVQTEPASQGVLSTLLPAVATAVGGPFLGTLGAAGASWLTNSLGGNKVGQNTGPYGGKPQASPQIGNPNFQLPNFGGR